MDCLLRPDKLETRPENPDAAKVFEYWFKTFESFLSAVTSITDNEGTVNRLAAGFSISREILLYVSQT